MDQYNKFAQNNICLFYMYGTSSIILYNSSNSFSQVRRQTCFTGFSYYSSARDYYVVMIRSNDTSNTSIIANLNKMITTCFLIEVCSVVYGLVPRRRHGSVGRQNSKNLEFLQTVGNDFYRIIACSLVRAFHQFFKMSLGQRHVNIVFAMAEKGLHIQQTPFFHENKRRFFFLKTTDVVFLSKNFFTQKRSPFSNALSHKCLLTYEIFTKQCQWQHVRR